MSSVIIGELGEPFNGICEKFLEDFHLNLNELVTFDSKGNFYQFPPTQGENEIKYYIYSKNYQKESYIHNFEKILQKVVISSGEFPVALNPNNLPDIHSHFSLMEEKEKYLKIISPTEIKLTYEKMLESFEKFKVIYSTIKVNCKICDKIKECYQYQYCGLNSILKYINASLERCEAARNDLNTGYEHLLLTKDNSIKMLEDGIQVLKKTELHPKMQSINKKYLIDIYFEEEKMHNWKDSCVEKTIQFGERFAEKNRLFLNEKNKLANEKNSSIIEIKNDWNCLGSDYDKTTKDFEVRQRAVFNEITNDFIEFKNAYNNLVTLFTTNELEIDQIQENCKKILSMKIKYGDSDFFSGLQSLSEKINEIASKMKKSMEFFPGKINKIFLTIMLIDGSLQAMREKFNDYRIRLAQLEESFASLKNPASFPEAYQMSVNEIKRRITNDLIIKKYIDMINNIILKENAIRKTFIQNYGKYLPQSFFPGLKFTDLRFSYEFINNNEINQLPNLLSEKEKEKIEFSFTSNGYSNNTTNNNNEETSSSLNGKDDDKKVQTELSALIQQISDNFCSTLSLKDQTLKEKTIEVENLAKKLTNKFGDKLENCPMCYESSINSVEYQNLFSFSKDLQRKIAEKEKSYSLLETKYQELVTQTMQIKKMFFIHMNNVIAQKNSELNTMNSVEFERLKKMLNDEKIKNNSLMTEVKLIQAKYDNKEIEKSDLEKHFEYSQSKLNQVNEKLLSSMTDNQSLKLENEKMSKLIDDLNLKSIQIEKLLKISQKENDDLKISLKDYVKVGNVTKGSRSIFVPHSEGVYVLLNLTLPDNKNKDEEEEFFQCEYILDLDSFDSERKDILLENSLIILGTIGEITKQNSTHLNKYNLPEGTQYYQVKLENVDYIIGFPGEDLIFRNYNILD